jgi:hypothetical protein
MAFSWPHAIAQTRATTISNIARRVRVASRRPGIASVSRPHTPSLVSDSRERRVTVAPRGDVAVGSDDCESELFRIDCGELGNIGRDFATVGPPPHLVDDCRYDDIKL